MISAVTIMPAVTIAPAANSWSVGAFAALAALGFGLLLLARRRVAGTTLVAAWYWAIAAWVCVVAAELIALAGRLAPGAREALLFAAAMTTFCPIVAVLGAKRPQDRAWQWIVLSLWLVLALPAGQWWLFGSAAEIHAARSWFLVVLIGIGALNYLPTPRWVSGLAFAAGQVLLVGAYLPWPVPDFAWREHLSLLLFVLSIGFAARGRKRPPETGDLDQAWREFRNAYGALWALRIMERVNATAAQQGYPQRLSWWGFEVAHSPVGTSAVPAELRKTLVSLLRRFVSSDWLSAHGVPDLVREGDT